MYGLGRRGLLTTGWVPGAPHSRPAIRGRTCGALLVSPLRAGTPRARVPGPGNPRPAVTASAGYFEALRASWAAPSGVTPGHLRRRRRLVPVSALSLHPQLKTSNRFLETDGARKV